MNKLTFRDEFDSLSFWNGSSGTWQPSYDWAANGLTVGTSWFVNPAYGPTSAADDNVYSVSNGTLSIAIKPTPPDAMAATGNTPFLAGQLETKPSFSQLYGYFEINAVLPSGGTGISSAFWLLPESGAWPPEIDVFEEDTSQGTNAVETGVYTNQSGSTQQIDAWDYNLPNLAAAPHTYAVDWEASTITWYIDGQQVFQTATPADMHQPMYMLVDDVTTAVGSWNGSPAPGTNTSMQVNWVHAYDSNPYVNGVNTVLVPSDPPPVPPAPVTTGTGSDTMVLSISEDAYQGDAQFTVSVDGKQLGGTFTTTASHAAGVSQSFTFKGDWAIGAHPVVVNFLNDLYGGRAAADRNLYVNTIGYNGTATGQSAELAGTGPQSFSVTDTTAIPVTPPVAPVPSPDGTKITTASASPIIDAAGNKWTLVQSAANGLQVAVNGAVDASSANVVLLETLSGKIVQENAGGNWYSELPTGGTWAHLPAPAAPPAPSPDGTSITTASASPIIDQAGNAWTLVRSASKGLQIAVNGIVDPTTANIVLLETLGSKIVQENTAGNWYSEPSPGGVWTRIAAPAPVTPPVVPGSGSGPVSGGTTPSVSVTGDQGSLTKDLSQTGIFAVGGDTFVLGSGNTAFVMLGAGANQIKFIGASSVLLAGGSGQAIITADEGANWFVAGSGAMDVAGGGGKDAYVFHANSGLLKIEDFSSAKGDTLTVDKALQGSMQQASDGQGGTMLTFGAGVTHGIDLHGVAVMQATNINWG